MSSLPAHSFLPLAALSPTMESGTIVRWNKAEGDEIAAGDIICEVQTDKATVDFEATDDAFLAKILLPEGSEGIAVGTTIGITVEEEDDISFFASYSPGDAPSPSVEEDSPNEAQIPVATKATAPLVEINPALPTSSTRTFASPLARITATAAGLDISQVCGTGPNGRVIKADVDEVLADPSLLACTPADLVDTTDPSTTVAVEAVNVAPDVLVGEATGQFSDSSPSASRRVIAKNTTLSKTTVPHYYLTVDVQLDALMAARAELNRKLDGGAQRISVNDFVIKASALACKAVPETNSAWLGDTIRQYDYVDINVGMSVGNSGLVSPIVRDAHAKGLVAISTRVKDLAARARDGELSLDDHAAGTFTISNLGMFGIKNFSAIISQPQACILAVGAGVEHLVPNPAISVTGDDAGVLPYTTMTSMSVTLSCDHRVVDGAVGAQWLQAFKGYMEGPMTMLL